MTISISIWRFFLARFLSCIMLKCFERLTLQNATSFDEGRDQISPVLGIRHKFVSLEGRLSVALAMRSCPARTTYLRRPPRLRSFLYWHFACNVSDVVAPQRNRKRERKINCHESGSCPDRTGFTVTSVESLPAERRRLLVSVSESSSSWKQLTGKSSTTNQTSTSEEKFL